MPGYIEVDGKERADELARKGAKIRFVGPELFCGLAASTVRTAIEMEEERIKLEYWKGLKG